MPAVTRHRAPLTGPDAGIWARWVYGFATPEQWVGLRSWAIETERSDAELMLLFTRWRRRPNANPAGLVRVILEVDEL
jgi:hypothetical protein